MGLSDDNTIQTGLALLQIVQILVTAAVTLYAWRISRDRAQRAELDALDAEIGSVRERVQSLEADLRHLPSHDDLSGIHEKINGVARGLEGMRGELVQMNRTLGLINEHLLNSRG